jgi:NADPH-dependent 2,4-dienoyl-CoA reductase/sulfur reductase-like enzyme/nitrite reductase/ring-hydroxylating ferredoxin subunit
MADRDLTNGILITELHDGEMIAGQLGEDEILLVRDGEEIFATRAKCTHYGGPLAEGALVNGTVRCPWHHACFDLRTGAVLRAPALAPLTRWRVEQRGDRYFVAEKLEPETPSPATGPATVVIVGMGAAGANVADTLRAEGYGGRIVMISRETDLPYDRPNLSKDYLAGHAPVEWLPRHPREYYDEQRIELRLGAVVSSIDPAAKHVTLASGERVPFDALVLASGSEPRQLPVPGDEVQYLRTRRDAERLVELAATSRRAVVIGSSFIGLETAASLKQRGLDVTVVSPDRVPLERILGEEVGTRIRAIHEEHGVTFRFGRTVKAVEAGSVLLDDGSRLEGDLIVAGIGVTPAVKLARAAGIKVENGVVVNEHLETSAPNVWACGDIASWPDPRSGTNLRVEHWVVAGRQGQTVARNILGKREPFNAVPFFWSAHYDVTIAYVGNAAGWETVEILGSLEKNDATIVYRRGTQVLAVATIGRDTISLAAELAMERGDWTGLNALLS